MACVVARLTAFGKVDQLQACCEDLPEITFPAKGDHKACADLSRLEVILALFSQGKRVFQMGDALGQAVGAHKQVAERTQGGGRQVVVFELPGDFETALRVRVYDQLETDKILNELMGKDASARFRFIMDRASEADELDV